MSLIQTGRYSDLMRRLLSMKGVTEVTSELSPEISPVFILESERPEWEFLKNEKLMAMVFGTAAVAAQNSVVRLRNPANSGVVAILQVVMISVDTLTSLIGERRAEQVDLGTVLPTVSRDTRLPILNASALTASQGNNVTLTGESWWTSRTIANISRAEYLNMVLTPGNQIDFATLTNQISIRGYLHWRERRLDQMEEVDG